MSETRYTEDHEWVRIDDSGIVTVGISDHAQKQLGDIVFVELPEVGRTVAKGDALGVVESVKAASDIYAPLAGEIVEVNQALDGEPALVNSSAESDGWFVRIKAGDVSTTADLMDDEAYRSYLADLD